ncbi:MAG TPA: prephenate dehydratase, partial [Acidimicrobiaceae bacterium]|nr:prephenate dehydratase [Acidimicrobiaceae bacterium]
MAPDQPPKRIGYLGPRGTYTEYALGSRPELAAADARGYPSIPDVLAALADGEVDAGFVPIENSIEGAVNVTQDALAFDLDLLVQREVVVDVRLDLLAPPGTALDDVHTVVSFPVALAQCRNFLRTRLADVRTEAAKSTAEAARRLGEDLPAGVATVASPLAGEVYGLETLATAVEDHPGNQTRFLLLAPTGIPAPTGHDKTSVVVFQRRNAPGSLLAILQEFAARGIDLTRLESRPTRRSLGDYCFLLDFVGHVADEVVSDCLR